MSSPQQAQLLDQTLSTVDMQRCDAYEWSSWTTGSRPTWRRSPGDIGAP
jgi:hypothetical protein